MRFGVAVVLLSMALAASSAADEPRPTGSPQPKLLVVERVYDAGKVDRGTAIQHAFTLKNVGITPLAIDAKPG